jgi:hypothetical protein
VTKLRTAACTLLALTCLVSRAITAQDEAAEQDVVDFTKQITPTCELIGLIGLPPEGWFNVPIQSDRESLAGCQMMRTGEQDELLGILRLLSKVVPAETPEDEWLPDFLGLEVAWLGQMGYAVGEPLWKRDDVPMAGTDWGSGKAIGLSATIEGNTTPQEIHFLTFGSPTTKYLITLATPAESVEDGVFYKRNTADFGTLIRTLQWPDKE